MQNNPFEMSPEAAEQNDYWDGMTVSRDEDGQLKIDMTFGIGVRIPADVLHENAMSANGEAIANMVCERAKVDLMEFEEVLKHRVNAFIAENPPAHN